MIYRNILGLISSFPYFLKSVDMLLVGDFWEWKGEKDWVMWNIYYSSSIKFKN